MSPGKNTRMRVDKEPRMGVSGAIHRADLTRKRDNITVDAIMHFMTASDNVANNACYMLVGVLYKRQTYEPWK